MKEIDEDLEELAHDLYGEDSSNIVYEKKEISIESEDNIDLSNIILTTTNSVDSYDIIKYIDVISIESITGIGLGTKILSVTDVFSGITGSEYLTITQRIDEIKNELKRKIKKQAFLLGGNAVVGLDFENSFLMNNSSVMVCASGTVVKIEKKLL